MKSYSPASRAYWLVVCVFLLYQQPAELALSLPASIPREVTFEDTAVPQCADWEEYDGANCVCASTGHAKCTDEGGEVCDNKGGKYRSACFFALQMCQQTISVDRTVQSCGACENLKFSGGKANTKGESAIFARKGPDAGLQTRYIMVGPGPGNNEVFYVPKLAAWGIGVHSAQGDQISLVQLASNASYPEDGGPGMLQLKLNGTQQFWEFDETFRLKCTEDAVPIGARQKRFIDTADHQCADWEEYDGANCVCASTGHAKCTDEGGEVCDNKGGKYRSACFFALQMCQQTISVDRTVQSCGACENLKFSGGKANTKGETALFVRKGQDAGLQTRYTIVGPGPGNNMVFYVPKLAAWGIGVHSAQGDQISLVQLASNASYPGDGGPGMLQLKLNGTQQFWEFDETFRLECTKVKSSFGAS